jgi:predicted RNase H-like HicB family nuclease
MNHKTKDLAYYMSLHYAVLLLPEEDNTWSAILPELEGCLGGGETVPEALAELEENKAIWFATRLAKGWHIPEPAPDLPAQLQKHSRDVLTLV